MAYFKYNGRTYRGRLLWIVGGVFWAIYYKGKHLYIPLCDVITS